MPNTVLQGRIVRSLILLCLGAFAALGQAPHGWWWATLLTLAVFFWLSANRRIGWHAFFEGFAFGVGYFAVALRWIQEPFLVEADVYGWMAPFALLFMSVGAAWFWGMATWFAHRHGRHLQCALVLCFAATEATRSLILTGFPWALLGHIWVDTPIAQLSAWGGPHTLTAITLALAASLAAIARQQWFALAAPLLAIALAVVLRPPTHDTPVGPIVRLIQPNVPQIEKWNPEKRVEHFDRLLLFSAIEPHPDVVVWPETAIPVLLDYASEQLEAMTDISAGIPLVFGINRHNNMIFHNSFAVLGADAEPLSFYDKKHLVPFGEFIPFGEFFARFGITQFAPSQGGGFTAGTRSGIVDIPGIGPARALICYEGIFAEEITQDTRPRLMILITNDAWFGQDAGPYQHLAQARLRAIEQGLPMVRVANTGVSAMIDAYGRIVDQIPLGEAGYRDTVLPPARAATIYSRFGDTPVLILLALGLVLNLRARFAKAAP